MRSALLPCLAGILVAACATEVKAPTADAGQPARVPPGTPVSLDGTRSSDPQGLPLAYAWSLRSVPAGSAAALSDPTSPGPTFTPDVAGRYVVQLVVDDGMRQSSPSTVTVTADPSVGAVLPIAGFTVSTAWAGAKDYVVAPRGVAVDGAGIVYVAHAGAQNGASPPRLTRHAGAVSSILAQGGYLSGAEGLAWDAAGTRLLATTGGARIVAVTPAGVQSPFADAGGALTGIALVPQVAGTARVYAADGNSGAVRTFDLVGAAGATYFTGVNSPGTGAWGVAGMVASSSDVAFGAFSGGPDAVYRQPGTAGSGTSLANGPLVEAPGGVVLTPCPTPKLVVTSRATGTLTVLDDCATSNCANGTAKQLVTGLGTPLGVAFDTSGPAPVLYVTDTSLNAVFRVDGPFCTAL